MVPHFKMQPYFHGSISLHFFVCSLKYLGVQFEIFLIYKQNYIQCYKNGVSVLSFFSYRFTLAKSKGVSKRLKYCYGKLMGKITTC